MALTNRFNIEFTVKQRYSFDLDLDHADDLKLAQKLTGTDTDDIETLAEGLLDLGSFSVADREWGLFEDFANDDYWIDSDDIEVEGVGRERD